MALDLVEQLLDLVLEFRFRLSPVASRCIDLSEMGCDRTQPEAELQNQVQQLLNQIQSHLTVPESEPLETLDRAAFVDFGWDLPTAA